MNRIVCLIAIIVGLGVANGLAAAHAAPKSSPKFSVPRLERAIHDLVNRERRTKRQQLLAWDASLAVVARRHSDDMAKRKYFSHRSPEGETFGMRFKKGGYACALRIGNKVHMGAENIAQVHRYASVNVVNGAQYFDWNSESKIARETVAGWMGSPGHRANILTRHWRREGIGLGIAKDGKIFATQNFC